MEIPKIIARIKNNKEKSILDPRIKIKKEKQKYMTVKKHLIYWVWGMYFGFSSFMDVLVNY